MSWSFFHHISFLCHPLFSFLSLSLPAALRHSVTAAWWLRHCRDATSEWYIGWVTHQSDSVHRWKVLFSPHKCLTETHWQATTSDRLYTLISTQPPSRSGSTDSELPWSTYQTQLISLLCTYSICSRLYKQAGFNAVPLTSLWPLLNAYTQCNLSIHCIAASLCPSVSLSSAQQENQILDLVFKF